MASQSQILEMLQPQRRVAVEERLTQITHDEAVSLNHFLETVHLALINQLAEGDGQRLDLSPSEHKLLAYVLAMQTILDTESDLNSRREEMIADTQEQGRRMQERLHARELEMMILRGAGKFWEATLDVVDHALNQKAESQDSQATMSGILSLSLYDFLQTSPLLSPVRNKTDLFEPVAFAIELKDAFFKILKMEEALTSPEFPLDILVRRLYQTNTLDRLLAALEPYFRGEDLEAEIQRNVLHADSLLLGIDTKKKELEQILR